MRKFARIPEKALVGLKTHGKLAFLALDCGFCDPSHLALGFAFAAFVVPFLIGSWPGRKTGITLSE